MTNTEEPQVISHSPLVKLIMRIWESGGLLENIKMKKDRKRLPYPRKKGAIK